MRAVRNAKQVSSLSCIFGSSGILDRPFCWCWCSGVRSITILPLLEKSIRSFASLDRPCPVCVVNTYTVTRDGQFCERFRDGGSTVGTGARRGTKPWPENVKELMRTLAVGSRFGQDPPPSFSAPTLAFTIQTMETRSSTLAGNLIVAEEPAGEMAFETAQRREPDCSGSRHGRGADTG